MKDEAINEMIDSYISASAEQIDVKAIVETVAPRVDYKSSEVQAIVKSYIEQKARQRISKIKGTDNLREFFAAPVDGKCGVYMSVPKSRNDISLEKAAESIGGKIEGMQASHDKIMSRVFQLRHNTEIRDDGTIDMKTPYADKA